MTFSQSLVFHGFPDCPASAGKSGVRRTTFCASLAERADGVGAGPRALRDDPPAEGGEELGHQVPLMRGVPAGSECVGERSRRTIEMCSRR